MEDDSLSQVNVKEYKIRKIEIYEEIKQLTEIKTKVKCM